MRNCALDLYEIRSVRAMPSVGMTVGWKKSELLISRNMFNEKFVCAYAHANFFELYLPDGK